jgi:hypothetical protein
MTTVGSARISIPAILPIKIPLRVAPVWRVARPFVVYRPVWTRSGPV